MPSATVKQSIASPKAIKRISQIVIYFSRSKIRDYNPASKNFGHEGAIESGRTVIFGKIVYQARTWHDEANPPDLWKRAHKK
jgi:hypothetical protein